MDPKLLDALASVGGSADLVETVLADAPFGIYVDEPRRGCIYANRALLDQFGIPWETFQGFGWARSVHPEDAEPLRAAIEGYEHELGVIDVRYRIVRHESETVWIRARVQAVLDGEKRHVASIGVTDDVTEQRAVRDLSARDERLTAIGRLAGRIAHDYNNLLTTLMLSSGLLRPSIEKLDLVHLDAMDMAVAQAQRITGQMLTLARQQPVHKSECQVDREIEAMQPLLRNILGDRVAVALTLGAPDAYIGIDVGRLNQVVMNLAHNARDAMEGKGRVQLRTEMVGTRVRIALTDSGCGMPEAVRARILEPFFTTKSAGRGVGLGMVIVADVVQGVDGHVEVQSAPNEGTTVFVDFPCIEAPKNKTLRVASTEDGARGTERVLLVEDDDAVRQSLAYALAMLGYHVCTERDVQGGLLHLASSDIDALICDVLLPDGEGPTVGHGLRRARPDLPIVYISGFTGDAAEDTVHAEDHQTRFLPKPFTASDLARTLRLVLDGCP